MKITVIFKDGDTVTFGSAYQIYNDTDELVINYICYETLGDVSPTCNSAHYDLSEIAAVVKGECSLYMFRN